MIILTDEQAIVMHRLLTCILLNETYRLAEVEDALVWISLDLGETSLGV